MHWDHQVDAFFCDCLIGINLDSDEAYVFDEQTPSSWPIEASIIEACTEHGGTRKIERGEKL